MNRPRNYTRFASVLSRVCVVPVLVVYLGISSTIVGLPSDGFAADAPDRWADHPALKSFDLAGQDLPAELFLVRTRGVLPPAPGVVTHGVHKGVYLVSGETTAVMALAQRGCSVIPLKGLPAAPRSAPRQWVRVSTPDPDIAAMVDQVEWAGISAKIQWLVDFETRLSYAPNHSEVADSISAVFAGYGFTPVQRPFVHNGYTMYNVEATQTGTVHADSFYIICGHFDSISNQSRFAPGADDNASGVAAVLTAAEILSQYEFEYSIRYICFAGEEQGLIGSQDYATWAAQTGLGIVGVLNFDMIGYWESGVPKNLEIETNHASQWLAAVILNAADLYTSTPYILHVYDNAWWGDHASFWYEGFAAVNHEEAWDWGDPDFNPYYHTVDDLPVYVDSSFTVGNIQIGVAALAMLSVYVPEGTGVEEPAAPPAFAGALSAYPNPFSGSVRLTVTGLRGRDKVRVLIYDARGRRVGAVPLVLDRGRGTAVWTVSGGFDREIGTGVYFGKLEGVPGIAPAKIVYIK